MLTPRVGNVKVQAHTGILSVPNAYSILTSSTRGNIILSAAVSPVPAQSEGHRYRLLLEVKYATFAWDTIIMFAITYDMVPLLSSTAYSSACVAEGEGMHLQASRRAVAWPSGQALCPGRRSVTALHAITLRLDAATTLHSIGRARSPLCRGLLTP